MTSNPNTLAERLRDASRNEKPISTYARLCREAADALEALSVQSNAGAKPILVVGGVYETRNGPATYRGLDCYWGETTYHFDELGRPAARYIKPERLAWYLEADTATQSQKESHR